MLAKIVLIDNDTLIHMVWRFKAKTSPVELSIFSHPREFVAVHKEFEFNIPIYIDADLGNGLKGVAVARDLTALGFTTLYLTTGSEPEMFKDTSLLKGIIGKDPPF